MVNSLVAISILQLKKSLKTGVPSCPQQLLIAGLDGELMTKLAAELTGAEGQQEWDRLRSSLYCRLVKELMVAPPDPRRGHYWSLCHVFRCMRCRRLVADGMGHRMACVMQQDLLVGRHGQVVSGHEVDVDWNVTRHVDELRDRLDQDWGRVYWRLWSECHYLYCNTCHWYYPVLESDSCPRHVNEPIFYFNDEQGISTATHPVGRFPCCNATAYRYLSVSQLAAINACKIVSHSPTICKSHTSADAIILRIYKIAKLEMGENDSCLFYTIRNNVDSTKLFHNIMCDGSSLIIRPASTATWIQCSIGPRSLHDKMFIYLQRHDCDKGEGCNSKNGGFIGQRTQCCGGGDTIKNSQSLSWPAATSTEASSRPHTLLKPEYRQQEASYNKGCCLPMQDVNTDDRYLNRPIEYAKRTSKHKKSCCGLQSDQWVSRFSTRFNQDRQREWENDLFHKFNTKLTERIQAEQKITKGTNEMKMDDDSTGDEDLLKRNNVASVEGDLVDSSEDSMESVDSMSSYCSTLKSAVRVQHSRNTAVWNSHTPLAGCYVRIESAQRQHWISEPSQNCQKQSQTHTSSCSNTLLSKVKDRINKTYKEPTFTIQHSHHNRRFYTRSSSTHHLHLPHNATKTKMLEISMLHEPSSTQECHKNIWSFDDHSQELDYQSAAYIPLPIASNIKHRKYFKTVRTQLSSQWSDLVDLEKAWVAFLQLFSETELSPSKWLRYNNDRLLTAPPSTPIDQPLARYQLSTIVAPTKTHFDMNYNYEILMETLNNNT